MTIRTLTKLPKPAIGGEPKLALITLNGSHAPIPYPHENDRGGQHCNPG
jgi:hypothetical protein